MLIEWACYYAGNSSSVRCYEEDMNFTMECEQEVDGRRIAEVPELPGVLAHGSSSAEAIA